MNRIKSDKGLDDLKNILITIKKKIIIILISTLVIFSLVLFVGMRMNKNASFKAKTLIDGSKINVNLNTIGSFENILNSFLIENTGGKIEKINYLNIFISTLNKDTIVELLDKNSFLNKNDYANVSGYKNDISRIYNQNIRLGVEKKLIFEDKINNSLWFLEFSGPLEKKEIWSEILRELKTTTTNEFKKKLIGIFKAKLDVINILINNDQKMIDYEISYLLNESFDYKNKEILIYLNEQASIARELKIENGLEYIRNLVNSKVINEPLINLNDERGTDFLSFQWGYLAIERKIDEVLLRNKSDAQYYVREYLKLNNDRVILEREKLYHKKIYDDLVNNLPFFNDVDLETEYLNVNATVFTSNQIRTVQLILISIIISILINTIVIAVTVLNKK